MANDYGIFFSFDGLVIRLPVNPAELPVSRETDNAEYNVLGIGDITVPRTPKQKVVEISSYFPARVTASVLTPNQFWTPEEYIDFFQLAMDEKRILTYTPVRYMEDGTPFLTSDRGFLCTVESFTTTEKGGETGDFYYDLSIKEYRDYTPGRVVVRTDSEGDTVTTEEPSRSTPASQIVVGSSVIANGRYYYTSYGEAPTGNASGLRCTVTRVADKTRKAPYLLKNEKGGLVGWAPADVLQVVTA